jgi:hypothetical protein
MQKGHETWNVKSLYRSGSLTSVARELVRYRSDLVSVKVRWEKGGTVRERDYTFFCGKGNENHHQEKGFFVHHRIVSPAKTVKILLVIGCHT